MTIDNFWFLSREKVIEIQEFSEEEIEALDSFTEQRDAGVHCDQCGDTPIWAIGSSIAGYPVCFTCLTGETDASDDCEVL